MFKELLKDAAKKGKHFDPESREGRAKMEVLKEIKDMMRSMDGEKLTGLKKVTVMSPTTEGLEEGLEKAGEVVEDTEEVSEELEEDMPEMDEASEMEDSDMEDEDSSLAKLKMLAMKKMLK